MEPNTLDLLNQAAQSKDWLALAVAGIAVVVPVVLKLLGKNVPIVDSIISVALKVLPALRKAPAAKPEDQPGASAVVQVKDEVPKPQDDLK